MKKTLVALAVLAASGASFAQVTITGQYGFGYAQSSDSANNTSGGLGISDSNITFSATEDLGGGMKAAAQLKIDGLNRAVAHGGDTWVSLSGGFGTLQMGLAEYDTDTADQFGTFLGDTILGGRMGDSERTADFVQYGTSFGPVGVSIRHTEAAAGNGVGAGAAGSSSQRENTIAVSYAAGPLSVKADYAAFDNKSTPTANTAWFATGYDTRTTLGGNYDLGAVKLGLGVQSTKYYTTGSTTETFLGASVPLGALALGIDYMSTKISDSAADGTGTGFGIQATYSLSKRTNIRARYASYDATISPANKTTGTSVELYHNF
jgi:predicted porin